MKTPTERAEARAQREARAHSKRRSHRNKITRITAQERAWNFNAATDGKLTAPETVQLRRLFSAHAAATLSRYKAKTKRRER